MPTYDLRCAECKHTFEKMCSLKEREELKCPSCSGTRLEHDFSGFAKGGGGIQLFQRSERSGGDMVFDHLTSEPVRVSSKHALKDVVKDIAEREGTSITMPAFDIDIRK